MSIKMAKYILSTFLLLTVLLSVTNSENTTCCALNNYVVRNKKSFALCWDPVTNETSPIPLSCDTPVIMDYSFMPFDVNEANQLVLRIPNAPAEYDAGSYCIGNITKMRDFKLSSVRYIAIFCYTEEIKIIAEEIYGYCMVVSSILLLITALIYSLLPELRDLQGKSIINFCLSLGIGLGILAVMKLMPYENMDLCAARGFLVYFFLIASFFWTNAISIQIYLSMSRPSVSLYGWKEFIYYAIYAWGCPAVLSIAMAIVNFIPGDHLKPGIGLNHCWFFNNKQAWQYMYSVMTILIGVNICIFIYTSILLWRLKFSSSHVKALKYKFFMTVRLFIVMGIAWIFEMIGTIVTSHIIWEILDVVNSLQGVLIFLVLVVFRLRVIKMMRKHGWLDCVSGHVDKYLAKGDDEEEVVPHTIALSMDDHQLKS